MRGGVHGVGMWVGVGRHGGGGRFSGEVVDRRGGMRGVRGTEFACQSHSTPDEWNYVWRGS